MQDLIDLHGGYGYSVAQFAEMCNWYEPELLAAYRIPQAGGDRRGPLRLIK